MLARARHVFESRNALNLIVVDKKPLPQWLTPPAERK
jgi:phosphoketolase